MRSLHAIGTLDPQLGGSVIAARDICDSLTDANVEVTLIGCMGSEGSVVTMGSGDVKPFPNSRPASFSNSSTLRAWVRRNVGHYDIVEVHGVFTITVQAVARIARACGIPYVVRPHGQLDPFDLQKHRRLKRMLGPTTIGPFLGRAERILCTSEFESSRLELFGASTEVEVLPLPVSTPPQLAISKIRAREELGLFSDVSTVLFLGRFDSKKGLQHVVPAISRLRRTGVPCQLLIAGNGSSSDNYRLRSILESHQGNAWTTNVGFVTGDAKELAFAASDVFVLPSENENFGISVIEALGRSLPVLLSDNVSMAREVEAHGAGLVCATSTEGVERALREALTATDLESMRLRARAFARYYSPKTIGVQNRQLYERLLNVV